MTREKFGCGRAVCPACDAGWKRRCEFVVDAAVWIAEHCPNVPVAEVAPCAENVAAALEAHGLPYEIERMKDMRIFSVEEWRRLALQPPDTVMNSSRH